MIYTTLVFPLSTPVYTMKSCTALSTKYMYYTALIPPMSAYPLEFSSQLHLQQQWPLPSNHCLHEIVLIWKCMVSSNHKNGCHSYSSSNSGQFLKVILVKVPNKSAKHSKICILMGFTCNLPEIQSFEVMQSHHQFLVKNGIKSGSVW